MTAVLLTQFLCDRCVYSPQPCRYVLNGALLLDHNVAYYLEHCSESVGSINMDHCLCNAPVLTKMFHGTDHVWRSRFVFCRSKSVEQPAEVCHSHGQLFTVFTVSWRCVFLRSVFLTFHLTDFYLHFYVVMSILFYSNLMLHLGVKFLSTLHHHHLVWQNTFANISTVNIKQQQRRRRRRRQHCCNISNKHCLQYN